LPEDEDQSGKTYGCIKIQNKTNDFVAAESTWEGIDIKLYCPVKNKQ